MNHKSIATYSIAFLFTATIIVGANIRAYSQSDSQTMVAHYIDMGQANATLLEFECGAVLIDAGTQLTDVEGSRQKLLNYLDKFFERRKDLDTTIKTIIITHNHKDHTGALAAVQGKYRIQNIVSSSQHLGRDVRNTIKNEKGIKSDTLIDYSRILINGTKGLSNDIIDPVKCTTDPQITILSGHIESKPKGWSKGIFKNPNSHSLAIRVQFGKSTFLFTGDMQKEAINYMLSNYKRNKKILDVDVYEVGHHGSHNATTKELLAAMSPKIAVISASHPEDHKSSTGYAYGHPNIEVIDQLANSITSLRTQSLSKAKAYSTGWDEDSDTNESEEEVTVSKGIYCTCWDGSIRIGAKTDGTLKVIE